MEARKQRTRRINITAVTLLLLFAFTACGIPNGITVSTQVQAATNDSQMVAAAKAALSSAGTLRPVNGVDKNIVALAQEIVDRESDGVTVKLTRTESPYISSTGAITYSAAWNSTNWLVFSLTKNKAQASQGLNVVIAGNKEANAVKAPTRSTPPATPIAANTDAEEVAAAKAALSSAGTLRPVNGVDKNIVALAQEIVDKKSDGVTVKLTRTESPYVSSTGAITYSAAWNSTNWLVFSLSKNKAQASQGLNVVIPGNKESNAAKAPTQSTSSSTPIAPIAPIAANTDTEEVAAAKAALSSAGTLRPVNGIDKNIVALAQEIVDQKSDGVTVKLTRTESPYVSSTGAITYSAAWNSTNWLVFSLTKNKAQVNQGLNVVIPGNKEATSVVPSPTLPTPTPPATPIVPITANTDAEEVAAAKAALSSTGTLRPVEGTNTNAVSMAQSIVNNKSSGVTVSISSSANAQVAKSGGITYGSQAVTGNVTFKLVKNGSSATQTVLMAVPAKAKAVVSGYNVMTYGGAKGDGVADDTAAIQKTIDYAYSKGGGTVYIPNGTYKINVDNWQPVFLRSNIDLVLADGAVLKAKTSAKSEYAVVRAYNVSNISISGGKIIGDRDSHIGTTTYGHGISILGCSNVRINDVNVSNCMGDGIYVGEGSTQNYCKDVIIENFVTERNRRNGITIASGRNAIIRDGETANNYGANPQSGIVLEPNNSSAWMENIKIENVYSHNNGAGANWRQYYCWGICVAFGNSRYNIHPFSVEIKDCRLVDNGRDYDNEQLNVANINEYMSSSVWNCTIRYSGITYK